MGGDDAEEHRQGVDGGIADGGDVVGGVAGDEGEGDRVGHTAGDIHIKSSLQSKAAKPSGELRV